MARSGDVAACEIYIYVSRSTVDTHNVWQCGWKCSCAAESTHSRFPSKEAALKDAARHQEAPSCK
jgi:hypothetical protein